MKERLLDAERLRLVADEAGTEDWRLWGPYLAERQWGTVREDYSAGGDAWEFFPHDHARSRAYRWGEDGLLGISDRDSQLCFAIALWNGADPILKERLFGLTGPEGNHGEDVKEYYFYLDSTPTHSYMRALYKYPQRAFPYDDLLEENRHRGRGQPEYELVDTGVFAEDRYFDVLVEYAKVGPDDLVIRISATNRGPDSVPLQLLPTLWFRNTWTWEGSDEKPRLEAAPTSSRGSKTVRAQSPLGEYWLACEGNPDLLFTENETNSERLWETSNRAPFVKDGINDAIVDGLTDRVNPALTGTKMAARYKMLIAPGATETVLLRLSATSHGQASDDVDVNRLFEQRIAEADEFYASFGSDAMPEDARLVQRQAFAGLLWNKQLYHYDVEEWLNGDRAEPPPPPQRARGRNADWEHVRAREIFSMPDTWEYPWFAAWDLAFQCIPLAVIDPAFAKSQLILLGHEWFQHPNGQIPAYEWAFGDVNPPVQAWAAWRVYKIEQRVAGRADRGFLERVFHKLLLNFSWWVNRKDVEGRNVFQGGFLGLDNIGVFDRSRPFPTGGHVDQSDGTAWMGMFCLNMLTISLELARENRAYEDIATKFFEHFLSIAQAMNNIAGEGIQLWDDVDEFFYDVLHLPSGEALPINILSLVGLIPLLAVETIEPEVLDELPVFRERLEWVLTHKPELASLVSRWHDPGAGERRLLALTRGHRMKRLLKRMLDPAEFLSDYGVRSLSRYHLDHPYELNVASVSGIVRYEPAESSTGLFGGNSNWRGPVWFPLNYLLIESLQKFHHYYSDDFLVEYPTGSGNLCTLAQIAAGLSSRLARIFVRGPDGRPVLGENQLFQTSPYWRDLIPFHEYFNGDTGAGVGASHQTGWTALIAKLIEQTDGLPEGELIPALSDD